MELVATGYDAARRENLSAGDRAFTELSQVSVLRADTRGLQRLRQRFGAADRSDPAAATRAPATRTQATRTPATPTPSEE